MSVESPSGLHVRASLLYAICSQKAAATINHHLPLLVGVTWHTWQIIYFHVRSTVLANPKALPVAQAGCWLPPRGRSPFWCSQSFTLTRGLQRISADGDTDFTRQGLQRWKLALLNGPQL